MVQRQAAQNVLASGRELQQNFALVFTPAPSLQKATRRQPIYQFDCAVMFDLQAFC